MKEPDEKPPLVSIITPSFNQGEFLEATLCSVLQQDYPAFEYLVVDGGSSDDSPAIIHRYKQRLSYWVSEPDQGQAQAINKGLKLARGEFVTWINSDDLLAPGAISRVVQVFQKAPHIDVVYGRVERIDVDGEVIPTPRLPKDRLEFSPEHFLEITPNQAGCFWRRSAMEKVGWLREDLHYTMDYEYWTRLLLAGSVFYKLPDVQAYFRLSSGSKTVSQAERMAQEAFLVIQDLLGQPDLSEKTGLSWPLLRAQGRRGLAVVSLNAAYGYARQRAWAKALRWLCRGMSYNPVILLDRRWRDLGFARLKRLR